MDNEDPYRAWDAPALVAGALNGDQGAWGEIVRRHTPAVVARVRQFRLTPHQAEDVAQTVWLNLLENLEKLRDPHALPGWIATTARHECIRVTNVNRRTCRSTRRPAGWTVCPTPTSTSGCWRSNASVRCARASRGCPTHRSDIC